VQQDGPETYGIGMLIAEDAEGRYQVVGHVFTINEAREIAEYDSATRVLARERGEDPGICPAIYKLWTRNSEGWWHVVCEIQSPDLDVSPKASGSPGICKSRSPLENRTLRAGDKDRRSARSALHALPE